MADQIRKHNENPNITLMGHRLGSAIAGYAVFFFAPPKLILLCPFHSTTKIAKNRYYAPEFQIKNKFLLIVAPKKMTTPTLKLLAEDHSIIPTSHSIATPNNLVNNKKLKNIPNCDYNDRFQNKETLRAINIFIASRR